MIRKRYSEDSGNWHIDVFVDDEWEDISQLCSEEEADNVIATLTHWLMESAISNSMEGK